MEQKIGESKSSVDPGRKRNSSPAIPSSIVETDPFSELRVPCRPSPDVGVASARNEIPARDTSNQTAQLTYYEAAGAEVLEKGFSAVANIIRETYRKMGLGGELRNEINKSISMLSQGDLAGVLSSPWGAAVVTGVSGAVIGGIVGLVPLVAIGGVGSIVAYQSLKNSPERQEKLKNFLSSFGKSNANKS